MLSFKERYDRGEELRRAIDDAANKQSATLDLERFIRCEEYPDFDIEMAYIHVYMPFREHLDHLPPEERRSVLRGLKKAGY